MATQIERGQTLLLENLRFHPEEEKNDEEFSRQLAKLADFYVNDAFGSAHRAHASTVGITRFVKQSAAGLLMQKELQYLGKALQDPAKPFVAILGGAKVSDKIGVIQNLLGKVDALIVGGGMAYTFLKARGRRSEIAVGGRQAATGKGDFGRRSRARRTFSIAGGPRSGRRRGPGRQYQRGGPGAAIPADKMALDIGPATRRQFAQEIAAARTIVWNGPMGVFEVPRFSPPGRWRWRRRWPTMRAHLDRGRRRHGVRRSSGGWLTRSRTFRPAAARRWSFWRARRSRR